MKSEKALKKRINIQELGFKRNKKGWRKGRKSGQLNADGERGKHLWLQPESSPYVLTKICTQIFIAATRNHEEPKQFKGLPAGDG